MEFQYKEHFSSVKVYINSVPVSAVTDISVVLKGSSRSFYSISTGPSEKIIPLSRGYEITLIREPDEKDDFSLPEDGFTLSVVDSSGHTLFRGCAISRTEQTYAAGKKKIISIISNEKWEFKDFVYFGGGVCTAGM